MRRPCLRPSLALLALASLLAPAGAQELAPLLARARASHAWPAGAASFALSGRATLLGLEGDYRLRASADGRYVEDWESPELRYTIGHDGEVVWERDFTGMPTVVELEESEVTRASFAITSGMWAREDGPFRLLRTPGRDADGVFALSLRLRGGVLRGTLWVDRESGLPSTFLRSSPLGDDNTTYSDWQVGDGPAWPRRLVTVSGVGEESTVRLAERELVAEEPAGWLTRPTERPSDHRFLAEVAPELAVRRAVTGHVLVHPLVDGRDLGWFILDSGAGGMCIDPRSANALELPRFGRIPTVGVGGVIEGTFRRGASLQLGPFQFDDPLYVEVDLSFVEPVFGVSVAGICGYDLFARAVVELDLEAERVALHDPATYALTSDAFQPLHLDRRLPVLEARFEGDHTELFRIDTGSMGTVDFHGSAVERLQLLEGRPTTAGVAMGAGGQIEVRVGKLEWFELAGRRFLEPQVQFSQAEGTVLATEYTAGLIGGGFLAPFEVVFDYTNRRVALIPREE